MHKSWRQIEVGREKVWDEYRDELIDEDELEAKLARLDEAKGRVFDRMRREEKRA